MSVSGVSSPGASDAASSSQAMHGHRHLPDQALDALASKLGMSKDDLKARLDASDDPRKALDQLAEEKGISKQELRETIRSAMPARAGKGGEGGPPPAGGGVNFDDEVGQKLLSTLADKLGTTADDLKSKLDGGANLHDMLEAKGVSRDDVRAAFQDA